MSDAKDDGGPAFPGEHLTGQVEYVEGVGNRYVTEPHSGMTLRDYFAAKAMQVLYPTWERDKDFDLCQRAYRMADNMLKARQS